ncbi:MAG: hypothetical protein JWQ33_1403 [Ramlibacter sp.]|nr:hypothetical protein [Ramlibacter sp.]
MRTSGFCLLRRIGAVAVLLALAACGGGGSDGIPPAPPSAPPPADARNGDYTVVAANAREYLLALDFDARTWRMSGNGLDQSGAIVSDAGGFVFQPAGLPAVFNTARFVQANDTVTGGFRFPEGVLPFVAPRLFVSSVAEGAGVYNFLTRTVDTAAPASNAIFQGELTTGGKLRTCADFLIQAIAECPEASVSTGTVTVAGNVFTSTTPTGAFPFRIARVGTDKVFLRASVSVGTSRRFWVGVPATTAFAAGSFSGANTDGNWSSSALNSSAHLPSITTPAGTSLSRSGGALAVGNGPLAGLLALSTQDSGSYFAARSADLAVIVSGRDSTAAAGFVEIGRRQ